MLFVELRFFLFFAVVLAIYWSLRSNDHRKWFILFASYYFYGSWDWRFAAMLLALSAADWFFALRISQTEARRPRKLYVIASLTMNLSVLAFFKYFHFFTGSAIALAEALKFHLDEPTLKIILPVGVSFFTFQSLSYTIDVYRNEIPAVPSLRDYLMFSSFFPQLVAGPIVRPKYFVPQMDGLRSISLTDVKAMMYLFLLGYIKKVCIADNLSPFVDQVFNHPAAYSAFSSINATWLYTIQIFCDFSGYSDMAIAVAGLLGYKLVLNFDAPYLAVSIQDFWRRWHISLSSWIRDYIYISLGGRMKWRILTYRNLLITMLAGGLWHGAAWTFVAWGGAHGASQVIHQEFKRHFPITERQQPWRNLAGWFLTLNFVCLCWILFRSPNFPVAWLMIRRYLFPFAAQAFSGPQTIPS
ncbi:MBOAT family O-acyltransferase [Granulicella tundricola]|uniref:Membrane bound O-acyl transferase MBOAT family protein n=1 Tax=Granulicella tundricola (strain ATCC BAA-1859 / DSM 23138 / MP5ACTX9) TaxID=1198114 RepID=E8X264_GRATM|nr:MBOAT family O-acyltransferase [Granulicella tundricola]ADW70307.1 membrane bound O-acyl transferase MBOAT family protein [Granulicella tundricola MP5ACTX9]